MIELVDGRNYEIVGLKYTTEERSAALFSLSLYASQLRAGNIDKNPKVVADFAQLTDRVKRALSDGLDIIDPDMHRILQQIYLQFTADIHDGKIRQREEWLELCKTLGVKPFDLFHSAQYAHSMIEGTCSQQEFIYFGPQ